MQFRCLQEGYVSKPGNTLPTTSKFIHSSLIKLVFYDNTVQSMYSIAKPGPHAQGLAR